MVSWTGRGAGVGIGFSAGCNRTYVVLLSTCVPDLLIIGSMDTGGISPPEVEAHLERGRVIALHS
jgi:hypothetical protein